MVVADCESELFRESSRGLEGGAFFVATLLNRKDAKHKKGKDAIDSFKDFITLKADARFCQYFLMKYGMDPGVDNTPDLLKSASPEKKEAFLHEKVEETLRDLLPFFRASSVSDPRLDDHPLQQGRRAKFQSGQDTVQQATSMEPPMVIGEDVIELTAQKLQETLNHNIVDIESNMEVITVHLSGTRSKPVFRCKLCDFQCRFRTVCLAHLESCLCLPRQDGGSDPDPVDDSLGPASSNSSSNSNSNSSNNSSTSTPSEDPAEEINNDMFWNYKTCEFFIDSIFCITHNFEKYGDGLGCFIVNKIILPIIHGLKHSNYSTSIHRFVTRVLCEATPKEGLKMIHEKFSNRAGKPGHNIHRDRRMEYRIGTAKRLIGNLGPNFSKDSVQQVKCTLDIKEELYKTTRESHGVGIRSGRHNPRSDMRDYDMLFSHLTETKAHEKISGRKFGNLCFKEELMDDDRFNKVEFFRWLVTKNKEAVSVLNAKRHS